VAALGLEEDLRVADPLVVENLRPGIRAPVQQVEGGKQLHRVGLVARLALLVGKKLGHVVELVQERVGGAAQVAGAVRERQLGPEGLHAGDVVDHRLHVGGGNGVDRPDQLPGRGVE
jgi:hypothetical protein